MNKEETDDLKKFIDRVACVTASICAPMPAKEITEGEILNALYILVKDKLKVDDLKAKNLELIKENLRLKERLLDKEYDSPL